VVEEAAEAVEESAGPYSTKLMPSTTASRYHLSWAEVAAEADVDVQMLLLLFSPRSSAAVVEAAAVTEAVNPAAGTGLGCETERWLDVVGVGGPWLGDTPLFVVRFLGWLVGWLVG